MSDGSMQAVLSADPMHYRGSRGGWNDIDTSVEPGRGGSAFTNVQNTFETTFGKSSADLVTFSSGGTSIAMGAGGTSKALEPSAKGASVTFADVFGDADVRYAVGPESLKEEIVLDSAPSAEDGLTFSFELKTRGLTARELSGGAIGFFKRGGDKTPEFVMPAPYMTDSSKNTTLGGSGWSDKVEQRLEQKGSTTAVTIIPDRKWLTDPDRKFPAVIDPTITVVPPPSQAQDAFIWEGQPNTTFGSWNAAAVGSDSAQWTYRSLFKFDTSMIPSGTVIRSADLDLHFSGVFASAATSVPISAHRATKAWTETDATWTTMANSFNSSLDFNRVSVDDSDYLSTSFEGPWKEAADTNAVNGSSSTPGSGTEADTFTWDARVPSAGNYKVESHYTPHASRGTPTYTITGDTGSASASVNQTAATTDGWAQLVGAQHAAPDGTARVSIKRQAGTTATTPVADAIRWTEYATQTKEKEQNDTWHSFGVGSAVQSWIDDPSSNFGFLLKGTDDSSTGPVGGPIYETSEDLFGGETANRPKLVVTYAEPGVTLKAPTVIHADGPELSWSKYADPSPQGDDDLVGYQIFRGCRALPGSGCANPVGDYYATGNNAIKLVGSVDSDVTAWTDDSALSSTASEPATYNYWVVARTAEDVRNGQDGRAASNVQSVTTPRQGRIVRVFTGDISDTTLSAAAPNTALQRPDGSATNNRNWLEVGTGHPGYGDERALLEFDTSAIKQSVKVTGSRLELFEDGATGATATPVDLHALTRDFDESQATWNQAQSTIPWTRAGGDFDATVLATVSTDGQPKRVTFASNGLTGKVQSWVNTAGDNHGLLLKARDETVDQQWLRFINGESSDTLLRPRLWVEHLVKNDAEAIEADQFPERFVPGTTVSTPVTVTNTTNTAWPAGLQLSYRWTEPGQSADITVSGDRNYVPLGRALDPGESVDLDIAVRTPINSDTGTKRLAYDFYFDLWTGTQWFSDTTPLSTNTTRPSQGCTMMGNGLLCVNRYVEDPTSNQLGLEKFLSYTGEETGGGGQMVTNLYNGNVVWSYDALTNPSVGPATFVRLAYNSMDVTDAGAGYGVSVQASTLVRLGSRLSVPSGNSTNSLMTFIDGDGTTHTYKLNTKTATKLTYDRPAGIQLELTRDLNADVGHQWVFTRADGTRFYFNQDTGLQTSTVDRNGNTLTYFYDASGRLTSLKDSAGRTTLTLGWDSAGLQWIRDLSGRALKFSYNPSHQLTKLEDGGSFDATSQTFGAGAPVKSFPFGYTATSVNDNAKLNSVGDPRGASTAISYYTSTENSAFAFWPKKHTDRRGNETTFSYRDPDASAAKDLEATVTDVNGSTPSVTDYRMDGYGRSTRIKDANANAAGSSEVTTLGWDTDHNVIRFEEQNGAASAWEFDKQTGYPLNIRDAVEVKNGDPGIKLAYETLTGVPGQPTVLKTKTSSQGRVSTFSYDPSGNLASVKNGLGFGPTYEYNPNGTPAKATDARNGVTTFTGYDGNGYPQTITDPIGAKTEFVYDVRGNVMQVKDALGHLTTATYDAFGRPTAVTTPYDGAARRTSATAYDLNDNTTKQTAPNGAVTSYDYDAADQATTKSIPDNNIAGRKLTYRYDPLGRLVEKTAPKGVATPVESDDFVTRYTYDRIGQITKAENPVADGLFMPLGTSSSAITTYAYDSVGNQIRMVDPNKNATASADDYTTKTTYDLNHQVTAVTDAAGYTNKTEYDRDGLVTAQIDALGNKKRTDYDAAGQAIEMHVPHTPTSGTVEDRVTKKTYDPVGNVTRITRPSGKYEETVYDANNRPIQNKSAFDTADAPYTSPSSTFSKYDAAGNMTARSDPTFGAAGTQWTDYTYFDSNDIKSSTDPWKIATSYAYDQNGQQTSRTLTSASDTASRTMSWGYFPDGSLSSHSDTAAQQPVTIVDNADTWQTAIVGTWSTATSGTNMYGTNYRTHAAAAAGTTGAADSFSWKVTPDVGGAFDVYVSCPVRTDATTAATYTVNHTAGASTKTVNQKACTAATPWIKLGSYSFSGGTTKTIVLKPATSGVVSADALKLVSTGAPSQRAFTYTYDANGQQTAVKDQDAGAAVDTYATTYDGLGRARQVDELKGSTTKRETTYTYDLNANPLTTYAHRSATSGNADASRYTEYAWDGRNMVDTVKTGLTPTASLDTFQFTYDARGLRSTLTKPNGNKTTSSYHEDGLLRTKVERTSITKGDQIVSSHSLKYNTDGDRSQDVEKIDQAGSAGFLDQTSTYAYTPAQQVKSVTRSGADKGNSESYVYDAAGNVTSQTIGSETTTMTYDRNRLTKSVTGATTQNHRYDAFGRSSSTDIGAQVVQRQAYDGYDRIVRQQSWDSAGVQQVLKTADFDPLDRTTSQTVKVTTQPTISTRFNYLGLTDDVAVEEQTNTAGAFEVAKVYSYGPGGEKLSLIDTPVNETTTKKSYYGTNPRGDVETLEDSATGQSTSTYRYTAYGTADKTGTTGDDAITGDPVKDADVVNPYRFGGKRYDAATGSYDMGFRDYNPGLNRFLTRDMYNGALDDMALGTDPWNTNRYAFAGGNPISKVDLDGHFVPCEGNSCPGGQGTAYLPKSDTYKTAYNNNKNEVNSLNKGAGYKLMGISAAVYDTPYQQEEAATKEIKSIQRQEKFEGILAGITRAALFDERSCKGGVDVGCGAEIAMALPILKPLKALKAADNISDAAKTSEAGSDIVGTSHNALRPSQDWMDKEVVADYTARIRAGEKLPAIDVQRMEDGTEVILDGHHRYVASQITGVPVEKVYSRSVWPVGEPDWLGVLYGN